VKLPVIIILATQVATAGACPQQAQSETDLKKLEGTWTVDAMEVSGKLLAPENIDKLKLVVTDKKLVFKGQTTVEEMTFRIDPSKKPKEIDLVTSDKKVGTLRGIYLLEGATLKICYGRKELDRPAEFTTKTGDARVMMVLTREK
jgi:uncharacterized protein (TIGR03067 family)